MLLYIVRHGETPWNRQRRLQGQADIPLNENGVALARQTGEALRGVPFDLCFSSPLLRAMQTADAILRCSDGYAARAAAFLEAHPAYRKKALAADAALDPADEKSALFTPFSSTGHETPRDTRLPILPDRRIMEINFGAWEGLGCGPQNMEIPDPNFPLFFTAPEQLQMPEGAENVTDVEARCGAFLDDLLARPELESATLLVTTHGCAMRALLHRFYPAGSPFWQGRVPRNCEVAVIRKEDGKAAVLSDPGRIYYDPAQSVPLG